MSAPFNGDDRVLGVKYDGEWTVSFILSDTMGLVELPVRVGRGVADFLRVVIAVSTGIQFKPDEHGAWEVSLT